MYPILFFLSMCLLPNLGSTQGFGMNLIKVPDEDGSQVVCSMALLRKYFNSGDTLSGSVLYVSLTSASMHIQKNLLDAMHGLSDIPWSIVIRDAKSAKLAAATLAVLHEKPQSYFVVIENLEDEDLEDIFEDWKTTLNWNPLAQFVVYLASVEETDEEMTELMIEILLSFMNKKIYNVNVIGQNEENGYYYGKTVFPYHPDNNCGNRVISIETLDVCDYQQEGSSAHGDGDDDEDDDGQGEDQDSSNENQGNDYGDEENGNGDKDGEETDDNNGDYNDHKENEDGELDDDQINDGENGVDERDGDRTADNEGENDDVGGNEVGEQDGDQSRGNDANNNDNGENDAGEKDEGNDGEKTDNVIKSDEKQGDPTSDKEGSNDDDAQNDTDEKDGVRTEGNEENQNNNDYDEAAEENGNQSGGEHVSREKDDDFAGEYNDEIRESKADDELNASVHDENESTKSVQKKFKKRVNKTFRNRKNPTYRKSRFKRSSIENETADANSTMDNEEQSPKPSLYLEEIYRALFFDKFPKDLSGCPLVAAFRPWEPYIFTEASDNEAEEDDEELGMDMDEKTMTNENNSSDDPPGDNEVDTEYSSNNEGNEEDTTDDAFADTAYDSISAESEIPGQSEAKAKLSGIEYQLLQTIGERLHISIDLQIENRNLYHLFQQLIDGDIEMIIGGIDEDPSISQFVSTTIPYHQDDLTWCVAKARRTYNLFNFLASFSPLTWLLTFVFAFIATTSITMMRNILKLRSQQLRSYFGILFRVIGIVFSQSVPLVIFPAPIRLTFATTFFMGLMFINAYQSFLISTLTTPQSAYQISRVEEIYQQRMTIMGSVENVRHLSKPGEVFKYIREKFQMCYNIEECLLQAAQNEQLAVAVSRQHSFYNPRIPRNQLYCFDRNENLYVYLVTMLLPKKFHLLHKINPVIQHVIESGHMQKWARDLDMRRRIIEERSRAHEDKFRSLTLGQVGGSFLFMGVMLACACLTFLLERFVYPLATRRRRRTRIKIIKYLHRKFQQA